MSSASQVSIEGRATFMHLPTEIKNTVYELSLYPVPRVDIKSHPTGKQVPCPQLLAVSRQIHAEAMPVLYGNNCIFMRDLPDFVRFTNSIGQSVAHLRFLAIQKIEPTKADIAVLLRTLAPATEFRRLQLVCRRSHEIQRCKPKNMARLFRPWILRLIDFDVMSSRAAAKDPLPDRHFVKVVRFRGCKKCDDYIVEVWKHREGFLERAKLLSG